MLTPDRHTFRLIAFTTLLALLQACAPAVRGGPFVTRSAAASAAAHSAGTSGSTDGLHVVYGRFQTLDAAMSEACLTSNSGAALGGSFAAVVCQDETPLSYAAYVDPKVHSDSSPNERERQRLRKIAVDELAPRAEPVALQ